MIGRRRLAALLGTSLLAVPARADDFPAKPITLVVPFTPGGAIDMLARLVAQQAAAALGQPIVIDNRSGAGGAVGTEAASKLPNDGYNILVISIAHSVNPWLYKLPYDPIKAFAPIGMMGKGPVVLTVNPALPVLSLIHISEPTRPY